MIEQYCEMLQITSVKPNITAIFLPRWMLYQALQVTSGAMICDEKVKEKRERQKINNK